MKEINLENGLLKITSASFKEQRDLSLEIMNCITKMQSIFQTSTNNNEPTKQEKTSFKDFINPAILQTMLSQDKNNTLLKIIECCLKRCLFNDKIINDNLFEEDEKAKEEYYVILSWVVRENLPFRQ
jgi:hypothetical protein